MVWKWEKSGGIIAGLFRLVSDIGVVRDIHFIFKRCVLK